MHELDRTIRILIVEDNPGDVRILRYALSEAGNWKIRISVAEDGEKALSYLLQQSPYAETEQPDLIILDLNLPKVDGAEILRMIRTNDELRGLFVAVLSSSPQDVIRGTVHDAQVYADCYLTKPPDLDEFLGLGKEIRNRFENWFLARQ